MGKSSKSFSQLKSIAVLLRVVWKSLFVRMTIEQTVKRSGRNDHASIWKRTIGREKRKYLRFGEDESVTGVEGGGNCWGNGNIREWWRTIIWGLRHGKNFSLFLLRWEAIDRFWKYGYNILLCFKSISFTAI